MTKEDEDILYLKCKTYFEKQIPVHISLLNKRWANGFVHEISTEFIILNEFKNGLTPIFFKEIHLLETYTEGKKNG